MLLLFLVLAAWAGARELPQPIAWALDLPGALRSQLLPLAPGRVALVAGSTLLAVSTADGSILWRTPLEDERQVRLSLLPGGLILDPELGYDEVGVFDAATGKLRWRRVCREARLLEGALWARETDRVVVLDPATGAERATYPWPKLRGWAREGHLLWLASTQDVGVLDLDTNQELFRRPFQGAQLVGPGIMVQRGKVSFLDAAGQVLAEREVGSAEWLDGLLLDSQKTLQAYDRSGRLRWKRDTNWSRPRLQEPGRILVGNKLLDPATGKILGTLQPGDVVLGSRRYRAQLPHLLILDPKGRKLATVKQVFTGWESDLEGLVDGQLVLLATGGNLLALGQGPGTLRFGGKSELEITAESPQVPPELRLNLNGRYLRGVRLEVSRNGKVVATRQVPLASGYQSDSAGVKIKVGTPGIYRVVARGAGREASAEVSLTELALVGCVSPARLYVQLQSLLTRKPVAGATIDLAGVGRATTDARGEAGFELPPGDHPEYKVLAQWQGQTVSATTPAQAASVLRTYLQTDRPLYRPGQKVYFRGVVMRQDESGEQVAAGQKVPVEIRDPADDKLLEIEATTDEFGAFDGQITLPAGVPLGHCSLRAASDSLLFDVQEFRKPPFQVQVRSLQPLWIGGQTVAWEVQASYFFGGAVPGARVHWSLSSLNLWEDSAEDEDPLATSYRSYREYLSEGEGELDDQGHLLLRLPTSARSEDARYFLTVTVIGAEGREVEQTGSTLVAVGAYGLGLRPGTWVSSVGQPLTVKLRTFDRLGKPHAASGYLLGYDGYSKKRRQFRLPFQTGPDGLGSLTLRTRVAGYLHLEAESRDASGHKITASSWVWVTGPNEGQYSYPSLQIVPSKTRARPGETIRCLLLADRPGTVWLTVQGHKLLDHRVVLMTGKSAVVDLPVRADYAPEVVLKAVMPRLDNSAFDAITLKVPLEQHRLQVEVGKDREDFRPGKTAELTVTTRQNGQGKRSSVALAVVDEALLALKSEYCGDIHKFFHEQRAYGVASFEQMPRKPWVAGFQTIESQAPVRENFQDTAYWNARVLTDEQGVAHVSVPLPDNLTTWRATARAVSPPAEVGQAAAQLLVRLPIMVQSYAPRFLVHHDQSDIKTLAYNRTPESQSLQVQLEPTGATALEPVQSQATVAPDASTELRTRIQADSQTEVTLLARAQAGPEGDAERIKVPVKPFALPREQYFSALLNEPRELEYRLPEEALLGHLEIRHDGSPAAIVAGALRYLADYPYGCVEQTMSRFGPTLTASKALQKLNLPSPVPETELQAMVKASLQALYGYQHDDGGWGWWKEDATNAFLTGYVISGLVRCREAGWPIDEEVLARGVKSAAEQLENQSGRESRAYLAWALSLAGQPPMEVLTELYGDPKLSTYGRALMALALQKAGQKPDLSPLRQLARQDDSGVHWEAEAPTAYGWTDDNLEATCLVLQALLADNPQDPLLAGGANWILSQRRGDRWKSTKDSAVAVFFLVDYLVARGETAPGAPLEVRLDGQPVTLADGKARLELGPGSHQLGLAPQGPSLVSVHLAYQEAPHLDVLAPESQGLKVDRYYRRPGQRAPLMAPVHPQDDLEVVIDLEAPQPLEYVMIEDPRAAGMEVPEQEVSSVSRFEIRDDRVVFFLTYLRAGHTQLVYRQRAETPGRFQALPTRAVLMYRPEVYGTSQSRPLEILR